MTSFLIHSAECDADLARCFSVLQELRPHLTSNTFVATVRRLERDGYHLVMAEREDQIVAVAGFRFGDNLARGRFMYVDDLVTKASCQRRGHGAGLMAWLIQKAKSESCVELHLDSGVQRAEAHAFYESEGLRFSSRHYSLKLP